MGFSSREFERRRASVLESMREAGLDALYIASPPNITYLTGFEFIPTERPISVILVGSGELIAYVPLLEAEHFEKYAYVDSVEWYNEYPDEIHPINRIAELLKQLGLEGRKIGYDVDGYGHVFGYRGPKLSDVFRADYVYARDIVEKLRMKKSSEEIGILRESAKWATLAHRLLQEYTVPGLIEDDISLRASYEATMAMIKALPGFRGLRAMAGFRGQVGPHSYYPHSLSIHAVVKKGQVLVTGASAKINGYSAELERTLFVGKPSRRHEEFFNFMMKAREVALDNIKPGIKCNDIDREVRRFYKDNGLYKYWRHHTGHGIGIEYHEAPFLDIGDSTIIEPGMVLTIEPGFYVENLGGFRHSDTILVVDDGYEFITHYPTDLDDLIIDV